LTGEGERSKIPQINENGFHYQKLVLSIFGGISMNDRKVILISFLFLIVIFILTACNSQVGQPTAGEGESADTLKVVATTTIVGDVVSQVGGGQIDFNVLLPIGADPHTFDPTPQDIAKVAEADLVFANGAGLEKFLDPLIESAGAENKVIHVSEGIDLLMFEGEHDHDPEGEEHHEEHENEEHEGEEHGHEADKHDNQVEEHERVDTGADPHTWTNPNNVLTWVHNIEKALSEADPYNAETYSANAGKYESELESLDAWMRQQTAQVPEENRKLVTDHALFVYFADEYGFEQVGTLIPGYSTMAEPSAQDLVAIEDAIHELNVKAIFVGNTINPALAERVADDTGIQLVFVFTGSLSEPEGEAPTYLEYMRYNTNTFVKALARDTLP
jgi:ABC-type Zn uptake system ZnuABC Zn-binding protein ZnuA